MKKQQYGAAILLMAVMLIVMALLSVVFMARYSIMQTKTSSNQYSSAQAFEAGEAGLEYGLAYFNTNKATIIASATGGFINYSLASTTLSNNAQYQVVYTNPTANNFNLIQVTSTGTSADNTSTRTVSQLAAQAPPSLFTLTTQGSVFVNGHGGTVTGPYAVSAGGTVDPLAPANGQINQNDSSIANMSGNEFFTSVFGISEATMQSQSTIYNDPSSVPWSSLSGNVWINGNVSIAGSTTAGSAASPIILVINGSYTAAGNTKIYGVVYVTGTSSLNVGNANVTGALITQGDVTLNGNAGVTYDSNIITMLLGSNSTVISYAKVPGSWKDF